MNSLSISIYNIIFRLIHSNEVISNLLSHSLRYYLAVTEVQNAQNARENGKLFYYKIRFITAKLIRVLLVL